MKIASLSACPSGSVSSCPVPSAARAANSSGEPTTRDDGEHGGDQDASEVDESRAHRSGCSSLRVSAAYVENVVNPGDAHTEERPHEAVRHPNLGDQHHEDIDQKATNHVGDERAPREASRLRGQPFSETVTRNRSDATADGNHDKHRTMCASDFAPLGRGSEIEKRIDRSVWSTSPLTQASYLSLTTALVK